MRVPYADVARAASDGSPAVLEAVGRLIGFGAEEQRALGQGVPSWAWLALGIGAGVVIGARAYRRWPAQMRTIAGG